MNRLREALRANDELDGNVSEEHYDLLVAAARCMADAGEFDDTVADVIEKALWEHHVNVDNYVNCRAGKADRCYGTTGHVLAALHEAGFEVVPRFRQERNSE